MGDGAVSSHLSCPYCRKPLRVRTALGPGRLVLCSGCQRSFSPPPPRDHVAPLPSRPLPPPMPVVGVRPAPVPDESRPGTSPWALVGAVAGLLLLLGGATAVAVSLSRVEPAGDEGPADTASVPGPGGGPPPVAPRRDDEQPPDGTPVTDRGGAPQPRDTRPDVRPDRPDLPPPTTHGPETARAPLPREQQEKVNAAIDRGAAWLRKKQKVNGAFVDQFTTALAALPALTLLECGAPADDPAVQKAARFVRRHAGKLQSGKETYELSLALLFLDRLGAAEDRPLIRLLAMRLVAGQQPDGGWSYHCPVLKEREATDLITVLRLAPLRPALGPPVKGGEPGAEIGSPTTRGGRAGEEERAVPPGPGVAGDRPAAPEKVRNAAGKLPAPLRNLPAVKDALRKPGAAPLALPAAGSDNSNTQFATLALWAALKHDAPVERSLALNVRRFRNYQLANGSWKYDTTKAPASRGTAAMTGAGLLGLAVGHGLDNKGKTKARIDDPAATKGLEWLGQHVGKALGAEPERPKAKAKAKAKARKPARSSINLYFLWTVERVGVLYNVRTMAGKDWYRWAVEQLLDTQDDDGSWHQGDYHGSTRLLDTCLALLVLRRADLAADLTGRLEFVIRQAPRQP